MLQSCIGREEPFNGGLLYVGRGTCSEEFYDSDDLIGGILHWRDCELQR
jgi:hypothetical protein